MQTNKYSIQGIAAAFLLILIFGCNPESETVYDPGADSLRFTAKVI
ncbi:MAG: hypothetical protein PVH88_19395 [Ignavibacteria bacterium]|jgi:hypothetical protein